MEPLPLLIGAVSVGIIVGYGLRVLVALGRRGSLELLIKRRLVEAKEEAQKIIAGAAKKIEEREEKITHTEEHLFKRENFLDQRQQELDAQRKTLETSARELELRNKALAASETILVEKLEHVAGLSAEEARAALVAKIETSCAEDLISRERKLDLFLKESLDAKARSIIAGAIGRLAVSTASELTTSSVAIENDDIKGKIIGKEGRNIRSFEREAGVELVVDDTPGAIVISSFDPIRRAVATRALEELIKDGRIQPAKIEERIAAARNEINETIKARGAEAVNETAVYNLDAKIVSVLGRLHFRSSYGQNVLQHSIEVAHLAGMIAEELKADVAIAKAGGLVHDIGKALDHEIEGSHVDIGIRVLRRFGADERIISAMKSHHDDCPHETLEAVIVQAADMISGSRPGARRDSAENYLRRLQELEGLATSFEGVERVYALQAGREIRVFVHPEAISDLEARRLARTLAMEIESHLRYPGEIKVTIIRETRIIDYAR